MANGGTPRGRLNVGNATFKLVGRRNGAVARTATVSTATAGWLELEVRSPQGLDQVTLSAPVEPDGTWLADDLTMLN